MICISFKSGKSLTLERGFPLGPIDSYKLLFPFSLREGESNFLTVMLIVLLRPRKPCCDTASEVLTTRSLESSEIELRSKRG